MKVTRVYIFALFLIGALFIATTEARKFKPGGCKGSSLCHKKCAKNRNYVHALQQLVETGIAEGKGDDYYKSQFNIACVKCSKHTAICAFYQRGGGTLHNALKLLKRIEHKQGCTHCGSTPLIRGGNVLDGMLTVNFVGRFWRCVNHVFYCPICKEGLCPNHDIGNPPIRESPNDWSHKIHWFKDAREPDNRQQEKDEDERDRREALVREGLRLALGGHRKHKSSGVSLMAEEQGLNQTWFNQTGMTLEEQDQDDDWTEDDDDEYEGDDEEEDEDPADDNDIFINYPGYPGNSNETQDDDANDGPAQEDQPNEAQPKEAQPKEAQPNEAQTQTDQEQ